MPSMRLLVRVPRGGPREGFRADAEMRFAHEPAAFDAADEVPRDPLAVERGEADPGPAQPRPQDVQGLPVTLAVGRELLVAALEAKAEILARDFYAPGAFHGCRHDPEVSLAALDLDLLVGLPVAQVELVRRDSRPRTKLQEAGLEALHGARTYEQREHRGRRQVRLEEILPDDDDAIGDSLAPRRRARNLH